MKKMSITLLCGLFFIINNVKAQTYGCLVTDGGNRRLYTVPESPASTYTANCGGVSQSNLSGYTGSPVTIDAACSWTPGVVDVQPHTCYIPSGGYCGKLGTYVLACSLDDYVGLIVLVAGFLAWYILRSDTRKSVFLKKIV
ncbi:hypothetical protein OC25_07040 [Pedobacter kyungheensis]|uniref:Uncharacterized protein n=1 Tax=Pedobacter kyungheensis TaxID=1069985 RepID=A0A0C1G4Q3_9SPHI|nr:hypothetical protein [Pedobacter kyungheensis]KIA95089.1 hypothetical protein OC25_07040 [Pedobacter kyungheensis]